MEDFYAVLGVSRRADDVVIKAAYRALSQRYHPDKVPFEQRKAANARMSEINRAYDVLGDASRRRQYDEQLGGQEFEHAEPHDAEGRASFPIIPRAFRRLSVLLSALLLVWAFGVEKKSAWAYGWELVTSGFSNHSHYIFHWGFVVMIVAVAGWAWRRFC